ncbi:hypothetical protein JOF56_009377 [Kibdelosporangium banguiense]|uniref:Uncharacterized protein n=1 Tax=Kibdelosporangium banguiense TaxID=1365924 RepID=A0ABS4TX57_9PSEU|nr:hypothetical protein [Kibdelosporangium banguiense]
MTRSIAEMSTPQMIGVPMKPGAVLAERPEMISCP